MRFIVNEYGNVYSVRIHPDTKREIRNALLWHGSIAVVGAATLAYVVKKVPSA